MSECSAARLAAVRRKMAEQDLPALLITRIDNVGWLTGFTGSNGFVVLAPDVALFATDSRYLERAKTECPGFEVVLLATSAPEEIVGVLNRAEANKIGFEADHLTFRLHGVYRENLPDGVELVPTERIVDDLRMVKDEFEIAQIDAACRIADRTFDYILPFLKPGAVEYDVMLELEWFIRKQCRTGIAFETAIASGPNGALPHSRPGERAMQPGDFVTLDFGARVNGYCSDITRTVLLGNSTAEQSKVYQTVYDAQNRAIDAMTSGASGKEVDAIAREFISSAGYGDFFGHGLGHSLGRAVHDGPGLSIRSEVILAANMVLTVEPGIYIPGWGGVRIEDDVVVTNASARYLTHSPRNLIEL